MISTVHLKAVFLSFLALCILYILTRLSAEALTAGGTAWQQGDWLINSHEVWVRRGPFGSLMLAISDVTPFNPSQVVMLLQGCLLVFVAVVLGRAALRLESMSALWLIILSPAIFPIFWAADFSGGLRKELIAYGAFAALFLGLLNPGVAGLARVIAVAIFVLSIIGHEINILLAPAFIGVFVITKGGAPEGGGGRFGGTLTLFDIGLIAVVCLSAASGMVFTILFLSVEDVGLICAPLVERGLYAGICDGSIATLSDTLESTWGYGFIRTPLEGLQFALSYLIITVFFGFVAYRSSAPKRMWVLFGLLLLPLLPLYPISNDWGRWLNMHLTSVVLVVLALVLTGRIKVFTLQPWLLVPVVLSSLFWAPAHTWGMRPWGVAGQVGKIIGIL